MRKTILITGTSSGFGRLAVKKFQKEGWNVVATMLNPERETELAHLDNVLVNLLDVTKPSTITKSIHEALDRFGRIDVLLNNAGVALQGPLEHATDKKARRPMEVNLFGTMNVIRALLPHFRQNENGLIINCSSLAGKVSMPFTSMYNASKFAIEGLTESLQYELNPFGIRLKLVEPGGYNTNMSSSPNLWLSIPEGSNYKQMVDTAKQMIENMANLGQNPQEVADMYFEAATDESDKLRYIIGKDAEQLLEARANMGDIEFKNMMKQSMGL